jgi:uncharacterized membrane protein YdjX (TVP38/TMEM64 family)
MRESRSTQLQAARIALAGFVLLAITVAWIFLPVREWAQLFTDWVQRFGVLGIVVFGVAYILAVVVLTPAWPLTVAAGFIFGFWAIPLVVVVATLGATLAFLMARYALRDRVEAMTRDRPLLRALDKAIEDEGAKVVVLLRLSPLVPFNLQNYFFGVTQVHLGAYLISTFFGIMPGSALYVYFGTLGHAAAIGPETDSLKLALLALGLVAKIAVIVVITRKARALLRGISDQHVGSIE